METGMVLIPLKILIFFVCVIYETQNLAFIGTCFEH